MMLSRTLSPALIPAALLCAPSPAAAASQPTPPAPVAKAEAPAPGKLFALLLRPGSAWKPGRPFAEQGLREHFHYWMGLFKGGRIVSAGPLGADSGLVLLFARDLHEAEAIMRADPAITARIFRAEVRPYAPPMVNGGLLAPSPGAR